MNRFIKTPWVAFAPLSFALFAVALLISFATTSVFASTLVGKVIGISDGDTIDVLDSSKTTHRIRLAGIDAPEKAQPFGQRSKEHLSDFVFGRNVSMTLLHLAS